MAKNQLPLLHFSRCDLFLKNPDVDRRDSSESKGIEHHGLQSEFAPWSPPGARKEPIQQALFLVYWACLHPYVIRTHKNKLNYAGSTLDLPNAEGFRGVTPFAHNNIFM